LTEDFVVADLLLRSPNETIGSFLRPSLANDENPFCPRVVG